MNGSALNKTRSWRPAVFSETGLLILIGLVNLLVHLFTNHAYGFHRDELAFIDNARRLDWGYVSYPPLTPFIARLALTLFGPSLVGLRLFSSLAMSTAVVLTGFLARELGGGRIAQIVAAVSTAIAPIVVIQGALFQYVAFDYLLWVLAAFLLLLRITRDDPRLWLGIGAVLGLGMMNKYTIAFWITGLAAGVLLTPLRRDLKSPWLWAGAGLSVLIFLPNLIWQVGHDFISLDFLSSIHERDVRIGRTQGFLIEQLFVTANPVTIPTWAAGLVYYFRRPEGKPYRILGWAFLVTFLLLFLSQGRSYYLAPAYPVLFAAGSRLWEQSASAEQANRVRSVGVPVVRLTIGALVSAALMLPLAPVGSAWWHAVTEVHDNFQEQIGWPELTETVAGIYASLPEEQRSRAGILTGNYGEAGAINLYGPQYWLPQAISGINDYWLRGYGNPAPEPLIVLGYSAEEADMLFTGCSTAGEITNRYGVPNQETTFSPQIFLCRGPRQPWPEFWQAIQSFG